MSPRAITRCSSLLLLIIACALPVRAHATEPDAEPGFDAPPRSAGPDAARPDASPADESAAPVFSSPALPEPALPDPSRSAAPPSGSAPSRADETGRRDDEDDDESMEPEAVVDGVSVGVLAAPELPSGAPGLTVDAGGARVTLLDRGAASAAGARPADSQERSPRADAAAATPPATDQTPLPEPINLRVDERWPAAARASGGVLANRQVIAYYGHPFSRFMGALGENELPVMTELLRARAASYDEVNGEIGVAPAFHIIYGTVYQDASVGILRESKLLEYIEFAGENNILVFLDHQIGNGTVEAAVRRMLPYLRYEHVHLAFDPEWATDRPGEVIGSVRAEEINHAQLMIQRYLEEHNLPGPRMLVVHQFNWRMIENRERVRADFPLVQLIHHADGFGSPPDKVASWEFNNLARNIPLKGFKLFYPKSWRDGGYDDPLMTPAEVMRLEPVPVYIQYQ